MSWIRYLLMLQRFNFYVELSVITLVVTTSVEQDGVTTPVQARVTVRIELHD